MEKMREPCTKADIVFEKPLSGDFEEVLFGTASGNTLWIRFSDQLCMNEWIGVFDCGHFGGNKVTKSLEPDKFFVCAGGWYYFVDATKRLLEDAYQEGHIHDAIYDPLSEGVLIADWSSISLIKARKIIWSVPIGADGIRNLKLEGRCLQGSGEFGYDGSENNFTIDLQTKKLRIGNRLIEKPVHQRIKPWWKFW